jgi:hypothetical protein
MQKTPDVEARAKKVKKNLMLKTEMGNKFRLLLWILVDLLCFTAFLWHCFTTLLALTTKWSSKPGRCWDNSTGDNQTIEPKIISINPPPPPFYSV